MSSHCPSLIKRINQVATELWADGNGWILVFVAAGWFLSIGSRLMYPALVPQLRAAYGMDLTTAGFLLTVLWFTYALGQFPGGILGDRIGEGRVLFLSTAVSMSTVVVVVFSPNLAGVFIATALFGASNALYGPIRFTILSDVYSKRDGTAIGLTIASGNAGNALLPFLAGTIAAIYTWRVGLGFVVPLFFLVALGLFRFVPSQTAETERSVGLSSITSFAGLVSDLRTGPILLLLAIQILAAFVWTGFTSFYPAYLVTAKGISPKLASLLFGGFFVMGLIITPLAGACLDQFGIKRTLPVVFGIMSLGMLLFPLVESFEAIVGVTLLTSSLLGYGALTLPYITELIPDHIKGFGVGGIRTVYMLTSAPAPALVGFLADNSLFDVAFFLFAVITVVALALVFFIPQD